MVTTEQKSILSVKDLQIYFNTDEGVVRAVDGVTFDLAQGKTLGVVGESGCGKSTVGRALLQILDRNGRINGGEISWIRASEEGEETINIAKQSRNSAIMRSIRGDDGDRWLLGAEGANLGDRNLIVRQYLEQEGLERLVGPIELVDQQKRRAHVVAFERP